MESVLTLLDWLNHLDQHLHLVVSSYGSWTYLLLFALIFLETGLVVAAFLPSDSLLFAAGALAAAGSMHPIGLFVLLVTAAVVGDSLNYAIGKYLGKWMARRRILKPEHLKQAASFLEKHGGKALVLARFVPLGRSLVPFTAGATSMPGGRFLLYELAGAISWVAIVLGSGYFFGALPVVQDNFALIIPALLILSSLPLAAEFLRARLPTRKTTL
jgi:membrane-associated protein